MLTHSTLHHTLLACFANGRCHPETAEIYTILRRSNVAGGESVVGI